MKYLEEFDKELVVYVYNMLNSFLIESLVKL